MSKKPGKICGICCGSVSRTSLILIKGDTVRNFNCLIKLQNLCKLLAPKTVERAGGETESTEETSTFQTVQQKTAEDELIAPTPICQDCLTRVSLVLESGTQLNKLEVEVRMLQTQILKLLQNLHEDIDKFKLEMNKLEGIVEAASDKFADLGDSNLKMNRRQAQLLNNALNFREEILKAIENLSSFYNQRLVRMPTYDAHVSLLQSCPSSKPNNSDEEEEDIKSEMDEDIIETASTTSMDDFNSDCPSPTMHIDEIHAADTLETKEDDQSNGGHHEYEDSLTVSPSPRMSSPRVPTHEEEFEPRLRVKRDVKKKKFARRCYGKPTKQEETESEVESDPPDDRKEDIDYHPSSQFMKKKEKSWPKYKSILQTMNFSGMSPFKKFILTKVITKAEKIQNNVEIRKKKPDKNFDDIDPMTTHYITYDPATDTLELDSMKILVIDDQEGKQLLQCADCGFQCEKKKRPIDSIYNHILGHHLKLFLCPYCGSNAPNHRGFRAHILAHQYTFPCDICQKPLPRKDTLYKHKWTHLSEEEKALAIKSGVNVSWSYSWKRQNLEKKIQCSTCGKAFFHMSDLQKHEESHQERKYMCTSCGKKYKNLSGLVHHNKYACASNGDRTSREQACRFQCDQCPRRYPHQNKLNRHKVIAHGEGLPMIFKCSLCEKMFKTNTSKNLHERTHSDARPFTCRKGCGATYKSCNSRLRHERSCNK